MRTTETPAWASKYLDDVVARMKKLETPPQKADAPNTSEDDFIKVMQEINAEAPADQAEDGGTDDFIDQMKTMNQ